MITVFEKYINESTIVKPDTNSISPEFWEVVNLINWNSVIKYYEENPVVNQDDDLIEDKIKFKLYVKYEYEEIKKFANELHKFYTQLYSYFTEYFEKNEIDYDEYTDEFKETIMSIIGKGKQYTEYYINHPEKIGNIDSLEGFEYLFDVEEEEYWEILSKYDPLIRDYKKYNL